MLTDTHAHLQSDSFADDLEEVVLRARDAGVWRSVVVGTAIEDSTQALQLAQTHTEIAAAVGIHPSEATKAAGASTFRELGRLAGHREVIAVGEIGLDFYRYEETTELQEELLEAQLHLAAQMELPVIVHSRGALDRLQGILGSWKGDIVGGVMHCFPGGSEQGRSFIEIDYVLGFGGAVTFPRSRALSVLKDLGLGHAVLETDCPYLAPVPKRGKRNEPSYLRFVAARVASELGVTPDSVAETTTANARRLFDLNSLLPPGRTSRTHGRAESSEAADPTAGLSR